VVDVTTQTVPSALEELKVKQQKIWSSGDYGRIAWITVPLARELADAVELRPGATVLDVATGTGHVALEAARTMCEVTGIDYVPELVDARRPRPSRWTSRSETPRLCRSPTVRSTSCCRRSA
jgi:2-polyprenyl-3-methyl-5-hydroxy-6-metoxy-1,4-benzoquinol methylase